MYIYIYAYIFLSFIFGHLSREVVSIRMETSCVYVCTNQKLQNRGNINHLGAILNIQNRQRKLYVYGSIPVFSVDELYVLALFICMNKKPIIL